MHTVSGFTSGESERNVSGGIVQGVLENDSFWREPVGRPSHASSSGMLARAILKETAGGEFVAHRKLKRRSYKGPQSSEAPPCMRWRRGTDIPDGDASRWQHRRGNRVLSAELPLIDGGTREIYLYSADPQVAAARLRREVLKALAEGKLPPNSKAALIYGPRPIAASRKGGKLIRPFKAPRYMVWRTLPSGRTVLRAQIPLKGRRPVEKSLGDAADADTARERIKSLIEELVAADRLDADSDIVKLYYKATIKEADLHRGCKSKKAPPCMTWDYGVDLPDGDATPRGRRRVNGDGRVLRASVRLSDGRWMRNCLNTRNEELATTRLSVLIINKIAEGKLDRNSKPARIYGGLEAISPSESRTTARPVEATKTGRVKRVAGRKKKWIGAGGGVTDDAMTYHGLVKAALDAGAPSVRQAIKNVHPQIPKSQKTSSPGSGGRPLSIITLANRYYELDRILNQRL